MIEKIPRYTAAAAVLATAALVLLQRWRPIPLPPSLTFLLESPITERFVGERVLLERLHLAPGMKVLDAGCGPGRLTIPVAKAVGPGGQVVALDGQPAMLEKLEGRLEAEGSRNVRPLRGELGAEALDEGGFDRVLLVMVIGEVRDRARALRGLHAALRPGGILSVTEAFGDPDYRLPPTVRREAEAAGFRLVERFGGFLVYTMNFEKPEG